MIVIKNILSVFISILIISITNYSIAAEITKSDYEQFKNYINILAKCLDCKNNGISEDEYNTNLYKVTVWMEKTFPMLPTEKRNELIKMGYNYLSVLNAMNPDRENCTQLIDTWNKTKWPDIKIDEMNEKSNINVKDDRETNNWICKKSYAKIDNRASVSCFNFSTDKIEIGGSQKSAVLVIRCKDNSTEAFIGWPRYLGRGISHKVETKVDNKSIEKREWNSSTDGEAVFREKPINWIKSLKDGKKIIVRLKPYSSGYEELEFNIIGINDVIEQVSEICKWKK